jgi:glucose-6-phosphate 1-dehydrogenase
LLDDGLRIVGVDHNAISDEGFAQKLEDFIRTEAAAKVGKGDQALIRPVGQARQRHQLRPGRFPGRQHLSALAAKIADSGTAMRCSTWPPRHVFQ